MVISGVNAEELADIIQVHKRVSHRKTFEETRLGKLPPEIMLKILGYVTPDCRKCFRQRDLLRLGTVCKKLNQLTKTADLFREIRLTDECCPLPTVEVLTGMLENSGAKTRKIVCSYKCRELLFKALHICGDTVEKIQVKSKEGSSNEEFSMLLKYMTQFNLEALTLFTFANIIFKIDVIKDNEPFYCRKLQFEHWFDSKEDSECSNMLAGVVSRFHVFALSRLYNLKQVRVILPTVDPAKTHMIFERNLDKLRSYHGDLSATRSHYKATSDYDKERGQIDITVERSDECPQFHTVPEPRTVPELAFKNFLEELKHYSTKYAIQGAI